MSYSHLVNNEEFRQKIRDMGYEPNEADFKRLIIDALKVMSLSALARYLGVSREIVQNHVKKYGIKNPNKPGGANNPKGYKGNKATRIDRNKGAV